MQKRPPDPCPLFPIPPVLLGHFAGEATVARVMAQLPQAGYAHFATHGFFEEKLLTDERKREKEIFKRWEFQEAGTKRSGSGLRSPLSFTGLVLAGANAGPKAGPEGGILSSEAIVELPLEGLRLAVLSACETGLGELTEGEGVEGLQRAFHLAGCPNVVTSLWKVDDWATQELMKRFYENLWQKNMNPLLALREAQLYLLRHGPGDSAHPHYWAAWTFSGVPPDSSHIATALVESIPEPKSFQTPVTPGNSEVILLSVAGVGLLAVLALTFFVRRKYRQGK